MKHVLVIYEGAADEPRDELEGETPLGLARSVHATELKARGMSGRLEWPRHDPVTRMEHAVALVLGVARDEAAALRRGAVEAVATSVDRAAWTYAYRGNFVLLDGGMIRESRVAGLSLDETRLLAEAISEATELDVRLDVIGDARVAVMFDRIGGRIDAGTFPRVGLDMAEDVAEGGSDACDRQKFMQRSVDVLSGQPVNEVRVDLGENPASMLWLWGGGPPSSVTRPFSGAPVKAAMVSNGPLGRGIARLCGMDCLELGDVWADTVKPDLIEARSLARVVEGHDVTVIFVEAPFEGGSFGTPVEKVKALDRLDIHVLGRVCEAMGFVKEARMMVVALSEEGVPQATTPVLLCGAGVVADDTSRWDEASAAGGAIGDVAAERILTRLLGD